MDTMEVKLAEEGSKGRAYMSEANTTAAEMTYSLAGSNLIIIDHTEVNEAYRGQGLGRKLLDKIVNMARENEKKILPLCPYAKSVFDKDSSISDVLRPRK